MRHLQLCSCVAGLFICVSMGQLYTAGSESTFFTPPASPRVIYNFNPGWKFIFKDIAGAEQPEFDDSEWASVSLPHTWNATDTYRTYIRHSGGDGGEHMFCIGWYRKHFRLPESAEGRKVFIEFDGSESCIRFTYYCKEEHNNCYCAQRLTL